MKKIYMLSAALLLGCVSVLNAQTRYWIGGSGNNWNTAANWNTASNGSGVSGVPVAADNVVFDRNAQVNVDIPGGTLSLTSLGVTNNSTVKLYTSAATNITVTSTATGGNEALRIAAGSRLEDSVATQVNFLVTFANGATGDIDGTWYFAGNAANPAVPPSGPSFTLPGVGQGNIITISGSIIVKERTPPLISSSPLYLNFLAGSSLIIDRNGGSSPRATWDPTSTIRITGVTNTLPTITVNLSNPVGNLVVDCANITGDISWGLPNGLEIGGNLQFLNTNGRKVTIASGVGTGTTSYVVQGNLEIGGNSYVIFGNSSVSTDKVYLIQVNNDFIQAAGVFDLRASSAFTYTQPTTLKIKNRLHQTGGTFICSNTNAPLNNELMVVELNGTANQQITSTGSIDNAQNMVTLRINNLAGATLMTPLEVGKLSWAGGQGILTTTTANTLSIRNTNDADVTVVNNPSNAGYVSGPVTRLTATTNPYRFPTGKGGTYRFCEVIPNAATASSYTAEYFNTAYSTLTPVQLPLTTVSNQEYWNVTKVGAVNAAVRLTLAGAIPGATATDGIVVSRYDGSQWLNEKGNSIPGNSTSGSVTSKELSSFSPFTFGFGPSSALPVTLVSFDGKKGNNNTARLTWTITGNSDPDRFEILRSSDGANFTGIGTVAGVNQQLTYEFTDAQLATGTTYYRLRMTDKQGVPTMSKIIAVINGAEGIAITSMMPTIVKDQAKVNISSAKRESIRLSITDMFGRTVKQQAVGLAPGNQDVWFNLSGLPAGAYQLTGYLENGQRTTSIRFVKR